MALAQDFSLSRRLSLIAPRARKFRVFHATTAGLVLLMALLASPALREPVKSLDPSEAAEEQSRGGSGSAEFVRMGMRIRSLGPVDTAAQTFAAAFDLWLVGNHPLDPAGLVFSDALTSVKLGEPAVTRSVDGQQYRLYRAEGAFRYRPSAADVANGRLRLSIRVVNEASTIEQVRLLPDREASTLLPVGLDEGPTTADGAWVIAKAALDRRTVAVPTLGDPLFPGASSSHSALVANFVLSQASPDLGQLMQSFAPPRSAPPLLLAMLILLAFVPLLDRYHPRPGPWRMFTVMLALGLLLAATQAVFATHLVAPDLRPATVQTIGDVFIAAWISLAAISLLGLLPMLVWEPLQRQTGVPVSTLERTVVNVVIVLAFVLYFFFEALHMSAESIFAASGVLTVVLGIALQNIILDLFSGILLNLEKPFRLLDWVTVRTDGTPVHGQVRNMNWRTTQLQTRDNDMVSIPNSVMAKTTVNNHAMPASATRYKLDFVVDARMDSHVVRRVMREAAMRATETGLVLSKPAPSVVVQEVKDYGVSYSVLFYLNLNMAPDAQSVNIVAENVMAALSEANIELAFREVAEPAQAAGGPMPAKPDAAGKAATSSEGDAILSPEDLSQIKASWSLVAPLGEKVAILFYDRLFEREPHLRALFRTDRKTQRTKLLAMLNLLVKGLDHPEHVVGVLTDLGQRHLSYGVKPADYDAVGAALLWTLEQGLGPSFDPPTRAAWTRLYGVMSVVMTSASSETAA